MAFISLRLVEILFVAPVTYESQTIANNKAAFSGVW